ncbi:tRNA epoxyqueuosine(34) reductase QueG [Paludisphaera rhizosphaerae]|uniref:tRNA epoxyqueuosine(34) reductase QueG n=1 Tax=Paludisphaera rhizosphaerae TaxID=2711216 RepID=UPI0013ED20D4|nr:tRNA epoxyqueuosine(34) reductase QueG [Paludisphaera rhizosphaerae]
MSSSPSAPCSHRLKERARALGFDRVGIARAQDAPDYDRFREWLDAGDAASMEYMGRYAQARAHPDSILEGVRSVVMVSVVYGAKTTYPAVGKIARYARGTDYHQVVRGRLETLIEWLKAEAPEASARAVVDTAPLLERGFARLAGLGWIGKNTMLIDRRLGSFTFLGAVLTDLELEPDPPHATSHCGTCTRCLEACPTDAFDGPFRLDARKCISYWTIEHKGPIPDEPAENLDGWAFGCDVCQDVCPWNRKAPPGLLPELAPRPEWESPDLIEWLTRSKGDWKRALRGSAMSRAGRVGLLRNAALLLGSSGRVDAIPALMAQRDDPDEHPTVREAAAWALRKLTGDAEKREPAAPNDGAAG